MEPHTWKQCRASQLKGLLKRGGVMDGEIRHKRVSGPDGPLGGSVRVALKPRHRVWSSWSKKK